MQPSTADLDRFLAQVEDVEKKVRGLKEDDPKYEYLLKEDPNRPSVQGGRKEEVVVIGERRARSAAPRKYDDWERLAADVADEGAGEAPAGAVPVPAPAGPSDQQGWMQAMAQDAQERYERKQRAIRAGDVHKAKGNAAFKRGAFGEAVEHYTAAINEARDQIAYYNNRAMCYLRLGRPADAIADADIVLRLDEDNGKARHRLAMARLDMGQHEAALEHVRAALAVDGGNAELQALEKRIERAEIDARERALEAKVAAGIRESCPEVDVVDRWLAPEGHDLLDEMAGVLMRGSDDLCVYFRGKRGLALLRERQFSDGAWPGRAALRIVRRMCDLPRGCELVAELGLFRQTLELLAAGGAQRETADVSAAFALVSVLSDDERNHGLWKAVAPLESLQQILATGSDASKVFVCCMLQNWCAHPAARSAMEPAAGAVVDLVATSKGMLREQSLAATAAFCVHSDLREPLLRPERRLDALAECAVAGEPKALTALALVSSGAAVAHLQSKHSLARRMTQACLARRSRGDDVGQRMVMLLAQLCTRDAQACADACAVGAPDLLVNACQHFGAARSSAAKALAACLAKVPGVAAGLRRDGGLAALLGVVEARRNGPEVAHAALCLAECCGRDEATLAVVRELGGIKVLVETAMAVEGAARKNCAIALARLAKDSQNLAQIRELRGLEVMQSSV